MRILQEGTTSMTGSTIPLCSGVNVHAAKLWVGAGTANSGAITIGVSTLNLYVGATDAKGFEFNHTTPNTLNASGTNGDIVRWVVFG